MSILIGYWTNRTDHESLHRSHLLLDKSFSAFRSKDLRLESSTNSSSSPSESTSFEVAVNGRNTAVQTKCNAGLRATISVSSSTGDPDIWVEAGSNDLTLGRGVFGRATLFWTQTAGVVWFASRLELLLKVIDRATLSIDGFYAYGCMSYVPAPLTPIENIFSIAAGSKLTWSAAEPEASPRADVFHEWREPDTQISDEYQATSYLRRLLEESVESALDGSIGPVGVLLSGGLDSSITAALLVRAGVKVRAFTLDLGSGPFSELNHAEMVADSLGIPLTKVPVTPNSLRGMLDSTALSLDGLYGDGVTVPLSLLYSTASKDVEIVFNGEGGDQLFGGWTNKPLIAASIYENESRSDEHAFLAQYMRTFHRLHGEETRVYSEPVLRQADENRLLTLVAQAVDPSYTRSFLHRLRRANLLLKGADNIQPRATNLVLRYNVDVRTLFCSQTLAEWSFNISADLLLRNRCEKYLLKRAVEDLLPAEIVWREKRGMGVPLTLWLTGPLRRWMLRQLSPRLLADEGLWQPDLAERVASGELSGNVQGRRIGETLWLMLMWQAWRRTHFEPVKVETTGRWFRRGDLVAPRKEGPRELY